MKDIIFLHIRTEKIESCSNFTTIWMPFQLAS